MARAPNALTVGMLAAPKLPSVIILCKLYNTSEQHNCEEHAEFRVGRGCIYQVVTLQQLLGHLLFAKD